MPYFISDQTEDCTFWAVVKEDGEVVACHDTKESATEQMVAISVAEDLEPGGTFMGTDERAALPGDKFTTEAEALAKAKEIGCEGTHTMDENGETIYMPCSTHGRYEELTGMGGYRKHEAGHDDNPSKPAPKSDQVEGSDKNKPGSAKGAGGDIKLSEGTQTSLRNKVKEHNEKMAEGDKPAHTRTTYGQLAAVYRRGSGAFSTSHRPGIGRAQWSMARVNAYLYLLRNGRPENPKYVTDYDLLPKGHPKSSRSIDDIMYDEEDNLHSEQWATRDVNLSPPAYMRAAARQGLKYHEEGLSGDGLVDRTVSEARAMVQGNVTADKWVRTAAWIARHMDDLDAPDASPSSDNYPSAGVVAHLLWGSGPSKRAARRVMEYAEGVVSRLEAENSERSSASGEAMSKLETRYSVNDIEVREEPDGMRFTGYAAVFNSPSEPLPFIETIDKGAFVRSIDSRNDIKLLWNHNSADVLGSTRAKTLKLYEDERGLRVEALLPQTTLGKDAAILLKRGDIDSMSFGFSVPRNGDDWSNDGMTRTLKSVRLHEISIVSYPAYKATAGTTSVRGLHGVAVRAEVDVDALADVMLKIEEGKSLSEDEAGIMNKVLGQLSPEQKDADPKAEEFDGMLELQKKKLKLLMDRI